MLTRVYIDNFLCFEKFEHKPARRELLLGANGSGKSSFVDALLFLRQFGVFGQDLLDKTFSHRTRWLQQPHMNFEIDALLDGGIYRYRLFLEEGGPTLQPPRVNTEYLLLDGKPLIDFVGGEVRLYNDEFERTATYPFDPCRSALATIAPRNDNLKLTRFKRWLGSLSAFRLNPFEAEASSAKEDPYPRPDLTNFPSWYRHLVQIDPLHVSGLTEDLGTVLDGFKSLRFVPLHETSWLAADFQTAGDLRTYAWNELSDGQRCLTELYAVLHFVLLTHAGTGIFDEPDNFLSLREIQPWLTAVEDVVEQRGAQVLIASHHPEVIDFWAPENRALFVRGHAGPVRIEPLPTQPDSPLTLSELIARGWERE